MYDINDIYFTQNFKKYRKSRNMTLEQIGNKIGKTKATVSKYENGEIIPDIITILEICNVLNISLSQLFPLSQQNNDIKNINPFNTDKLYLYYCTENILISSVLELSVEENTIIVKFYNGVKDINKYAKENSYYYEGTLECDKNIGYINLSNLNTNKELFEKIQISFSIPWSNDFSIINFFILALSPNSIPVIKKGIMSKNIINDFSSYENDLKIQKDELDNIKKDNGWILKQKNYNHFFFD